MKMFAKITIALAFAAGLVFSSGTSYRSMVPDAELAQLAQLDTRGQVVMRTMPPDPPKPDRPKPKREKPLFPFPLPSGTGEGQSA